MLLVQGPHPDGLLSRWYILVLEGPVGSDGGSGTLPWKALWGDRTLAGPRPPGATLLLKQIISERGEAVETWASPWASSMRRPALPSAFPSL